MPDNRHGLIYFQNPLYLLIQRLVGFVVAVDQLLVFGGAEAVPKDHRARKVANSHDPAQNWMRLWKDAIVEAGYAAAPHHYLDEGCDRPLRLPGSAYA